MGRVKGRGDRDRCEKAEKKVDRQVIWGTVGQTQYIDTCIPFKIDRFDRGEMLNHCMFC